MARGEPAWPTAFTWRDREYTIAHRVELEDERDRHGRAVSEAPLVRDRDGHRRSMTLYCERQARSRSRAKSRWFLYTIEKR